MLRPNTEELLILTKTYPSPSSRYRETTCVAALTRSGELRRLFPIPYRFLADDSKFKRWEWIRASTALATTDQRPESRRIDVDSIELLNERVGTERGWAERLRLIEPHVVADYYDLETRRKQTGQTLGFLHPKAICGLELKHSKNAEWTEEEYNKLVQDGLFDSAEMRNRVVLRKVPYDFHYRYICRDEVGRHKIIDWEAGALYWRCLRTKGLAGWEHAFRQKLEQEFSHKDLFFLMGTMHRFPDQWLIAGLIYPPKPQPAPAGRQLALPLALSGD